MDIMSIYVFYLVYPCGLILKNCNLLHYKAYLHRLVHDFVVFLSFIVIFNCYYQNISILFWWCWWWWWLQGRCGHWIYIMCVASNKISVVGHGTLWDTKNPFKGINCSSCGYKMSKEFLKLVKFKSRKK